MNLYDAIYIVCGAAADFRDVLIDGGDPDDNAEIEEIGEALFVVDNFMKRYSDG